MTLKEKIQAAQDMPLVEVDLTADWGVKLWVRSCSTAERSDLEKRFQTRKPEDDPGDFRATIVALTAVDEHGERLFTLDDISWLKTKSAKAIEKVFSVACDQNGFTPRDVEELEKNSASNPPADSLLT